MRASLDGVDELATNVETGVDGCLTLICGRVEFVVECARHDRNDWGKGDGGGMEGVPVLGFYDSD